MNRHAVATGLYLYDYPYTRSLVSPCTLIHLQQQPWSKIIQRSSPSPEITVLPIISIPGARRPSAMSSLIRSFASLYCQKLRSTTVLGPAAAPRFQAVDRERFSASSGAAGTRPAPALPRQYREQQRTPFFTWARLAIGSVLAAATPLLHSRWASILRIQSEVEMVKDAAEAVVEVVEEAATFAEKVSSEVAEQLPEGGRLRTAAVLVEHASKEVAHEAHLAQDIIHKMDEIEEDVKAIIEPIVDHRKHVHAKAPHISNSSQK
ncbi:hypothetical protein GQ55_9G279200 [Panicum hallii var. hallii]|uniref:Pterin-binding domain-containing protein n=1 Tax=Panicum hallii var. hallii TaxID=1504633 RepID=A0A2T7C7J1_9POAL|nr:hypothetical protein GQ55_9G279200 [Panicum hallii var. hallii]